MVGRKGIAAAVAMVWPALVHAQDQLSLWEMTPEQLAQVQVVSTASGTSAPLDRAASVMTVITADDIARLGASNIDELLQSVPGLYVGIADQAYSSQYIFRGITGKTNPQTLLLINGIPFKTLAFGNRTNIWRGMPVEAIARIEVIRGPGSALYGADAFAGVINVITRSGSDIDGARVGVRTGSFNTHAAWAQYGENKGDWQTMASVELFDTDGDDPVIESDLQAQLDGLFGSNASLAPAPARTGYEQVDLRLEAKSTRVTARLGYQGLFDNEVSTGIAGALDPQGDFNTSRLSADVSYSRDDLMRDWVWTSRLNALHITQEPRQDPQLFPPGAFGGEFPDGMFGNPGYKEVQAGFEQFGVYSGFDQHRIRVAAGGMWAELYETTDKVNFEIVIDPVLGPVFQSRGALVDVSDTDDVWLPEEDRTLVYLALQDEWQLAQHWQLTSGLRYDYYSDFGGTVNPRMALVWATSDLWTSRLMYGRAFRAPSFEELYATANPVALGDPDLKPEIIDSVELAFSRRDDAGRYLGVNLYYYEIRDVIDRVPTQAVGQFQSANDAASRGHGAELEAAVPLRHDLSLSGNVAWMHAEDKDSGETIGEAPSQQAWLALDWQVASDWQLGTQVNWFGRIERTEGDPRDDIDSVAVMDMTVRRTRLFGSADVTLRLRNLFDEYYVAPSPGPAATVPEDFPRPGFNGDLAISVRF